MNWLHYLTVVVHILTTVHSLPTGWFAFDRANEVYSTQVPATIEIHYVWSVPPGMFPNNRLDIFAQYSPKLLVCQSDVEYLLTQLDSSVLTTRLDNLNRMINGTSNDWGSAIKPVLAASQSCRTINSNELTSENWQGRSVLRGVLRTVFYSYGSILFVDPYGVNGFQLTQKFADITGIKHCEGDGSKVPGMFKKRPVCPPVSSKKTWQSEDGIVTVWKSNIVAATHTAYKCYFIGTYVHTEQSFFGGKKNNSPYKLTIRTPSEELCRKWIDEKKCSYGKFSTISESLSGTKNNVLEEYYWCSTWESTFMNCYVEVGIIRTTNPFSTMMTPWVAIPAAFLSGTTYQMTSGERVVWDQFQSIELCKYTPMLSYDGHRITHRSKEYLMQDPRPNATKVYQFYSDHVQGLIYSDDTQLDFADNFDCIPESDELEIYHVKNDQLVTWQKGVSLMADDAPDDFEYSATLSHPHSAYSKILIHNTHNNIVATSTLRQADGILPKANDTDQNVRDFPRFTVVGEPTVTPSETIAYFDFKRNQEREKNIALQARTYCLLEQSQYDWSSLLATMFPSQIISAAVGRPVQAEWAGDNSFNIRECHTIAEFKVVESLKTLNSAVISTNNTQFLNYTKDDLPNNITYADMYRRVGAVVDAEVCFRSPIIQFRNQHGQYQYGQLKSNGMLSTINMDDVEPCFHNSIRYVWINNIVYVFKDYTFKFNISEYDISDHRVKMKDSKMRLENEKEATLKDYVLDNIIEIGVRNLQGDEPVKFEFANGFVNSDQHLHDARYVVNSYNDMLSRTRRSLVVDMTLKRRRTQGSADYVENGIRAGDGADFIYGLANGVKIVGESVASAATGLFTGVVGAIGGGLGSASSGLIKGLFDNDFFKVIFIVGTIISVALVTLFICRQRQKARLEDRLKMKEINTPDIMPMMSGEFQKNSMLLGGVAGTVATGMGGPIAGAVTNRLVNGLARKL